ncbi:DUF1329 domain-containing protein [Desulfuromonas sp. TF]|uniref:DUF1329 domain-containing protein n=1 Tax=Desulfuromonas sp. TF TaxID=1232410 RepID=UPI00040ACDC7|nr:DUF1329 domain-containing protein [Desulfuromonas sp. TF]
MRNQIILNLMYLTLAVTTALAATEADLEKTFYPYKSGVPSAAGITPGMVINASNWQVAKDVLPEEILTYIKDGDYVITVGETTSFDVHPDFIEATKANLNRAKLGDKVGVIYNADSGLPFVNELTTDDPRAGEKLIWNFRKSYSQGDSWWINPWFWQYRNMKTGQVERNLRFNFHFMKLSNRTRVAPFPEYTPNPDKLFRSTYIMAEEPFDIKNTQILIQRYQDDTKLDNSYLYLGYQRRVRRMSSGQYTDAFLGSDITLEDFEGYNGRISDMNWTYKGTKNVLVPYYNHNEMPLDQEIYKNDPDGYKMIAVTGKGGCFPDVTWQLRKMYILESSPVDKAHPVSKRIHYVDTQTFGMPLNFIYDRSGKFWKNFIIGYTHADYDAPQNKGTGVAMYNYFSMIDVQADHCTTAEFKTITNAPETTPELFSVQQLRSAGR